MASSHHTPTERDFELLSAYLDGELADHERVALERRLQREPVLRTTLNQLQETVGLLRELPRLKAPRNFTLVPAQYGRKQPWWQQLFSLGFALQLSGALGAAASVVLIVLALVTTDTDSTPDAAQPSNGGPASSAIALQPSPLPGENQTATALELESSRTQIAYAGEDLIQTTIVAQSTLYAGTPFSAAPGAALPTGTPAPTRTAQAEMAEAEEFTEAPMAAMSDMADSETEIAASTALEEAPPPDTAADAATFGDLDEGAAPAVGAAMATQTLLPPIAEAPSPPEAAAAAQAGNAAAREANETAEESVATGIEDDAADVFEPTLLPDSVTEQVAPEEQTLKAPEQRTSDTEEDDIPWWLVGIGAALFALSASLFVLGRRQAR